MQRNLPRALGAVALSGTLCLATSGAAQEELPQLYHKKVNLSSPNSLLTVDLVHTPVPEIVITDAEGRLKLYSSADGEELQSVHIDSGWLTAPVVGDFAGTDKMEIAVGTGKGRVVILDGRTLDILADREVGAPFSIQPTVITIMDNGEPQRDRLVLADQDGVIHGIDFDGDSTIGHVWEYSTGSKVQSPMVVGSVRTRDGYDLVATTTDGHVILLDPSAGEAGPRGEKILVQQQTSLPTSPLLVDINGDRQDEVIVVLQSGELRCFTWDDRAKPKLKELWTRSIPTGPVSPPILVRRGVDHSTACIIQLSEASIQAVNLQTGSIIAQDINKFAGISTQGALLPQDGRYPEVAFGLKKTLQVTRNLTEWITTSGAVPLNAREGSLRHDIANAVTVAIPDPNQPAVVLGLSAQEDGHLYAVNSGIDIGQLDWNTRTPWMTQGGSPYHNPRLDLDWARVETARKAGLQAQAERWREELAQALEVKDWSSATQAALNLVNYDPYDPEYSSLRWEIWRKKYILQIITVLITALVLGGFSAYKITQILTFRNMRRRADLSVERGDYDEAQRFYERLLSRAPKNTRIAYALARVYIAQRDYSEETLPVYDKALEAHPEDTELLNSYARALVLEPKTDRKAAQIYEKALTTFPEPALLEYGLGRCALAQGQYEEAGKRLRSSLRGGVATDALYHSLCDVYLKTKNFTAKALPVFQQQFASRNEEPEFLSAYLTACIDAKKLDPQVESLCQAVLEHSPNYVPAYLHLARIQMQKKQIGTAIDEVRNALNIEPENHDAIGLMAQCLMAQNRRDEEALRAYRRALEVEPGNAEILRTLTNIYFEKGQFDQSSISIYHASLDKNPADITTLKALAKTGQLTSNYELSIQACEMLAEQGQMTAQLNQQLATAYVKLGVLEPRSEKVYREALRHSPDNPEYIAALARTLSAQDRTDADTIYTYEAHIANDKNDVTVGRQLAKAYIENNRYEQALNLAQRLLKEHPSDEELQRLNALASLYDNKIDEAVSEYGRILERNPADQEALVNLALAYAQKLRTDDEAVSYYRRALDIQPGNDLLHLAMARVSGMNNDASAAVNAYREALKTSSNNEQKVIAHILTLLSEKPALLRIRWFLVELLVSYGHLRESLEQIEFISKNHPGQTANALKALETILKKDPQNATALYQQGLMLMATEKTETAIKSLEAANKLRPNAGDIQESLIQAYNQTLERRDLPELRFRLGKIYYSQQEYDEAIGCFQKTAQDYRWEAESTKMLGKCFTGKGMLDLALQEFKKLVVDDETKELLYDLAQRYENKKDLVGAKTVYRQLFAADIDYKDVKTRFEMLSGSTSDPMAFERTAIVQQMSEEAARRYELLDELGRGAMGIVYRARDKELEEIVALKILPDNMSNNPEAVRRFKIEARNARKLSHPNIVRIHDIGEEMGRKYISMEYVDGTDLKRKIKSKPGVKLPEELILKYAMQIADALGYAHRLQIVHRDIKPANIMLNSADEVKVTDFGIAKMMDSTGEGTMIGAVIGTPLYMSPEQVQGVPVDNRADIYSLGVMLYELFSGKPPFTEGDLAYQHIHKEPAKIDSIPEALWQLLAKCLAKKKEERWEKAEDIYDAIREYTRQRTG